MKLTLNLRLDSYETVEKTGAETETEAQKAETETEHEAHLTQRSAVNQPE